MADVTAGAACHNKVVWKCPEDPRSGASRVDLLGEKINLFSTLKTEYRKKLIISMKVDNDQPRTSRSRVMIERQVILKEYFRFIVTIASKIRCESIETSVPWRDR